MSFFPIGEMSTSSRVESNQNTSSYNTEMKGVLIKKINEVREKFTTKGAIAIPHIPFIGVHERDYKQLFGSNSQNDLLAISKFIFKPVVSEDVKSGCAIVSHVDYEKLDYDLKNYENFAMPISKECLTSLEKVKIEIGSKNPVCVKDKKDLKQKILSVFNDKIIRFDVNYSFSWLDNNIIAKFKSYDSDYFQFRLITQNTKFVLRHNYEFRSSIFIEENIIHDDEATFTFFINARQYGRNCYDKKEIPEEYLVNKLNELIPLGSLISPYKEFPITYDGLKFYLIFYSIDIPSRALTEDKFGPKLEDFQFNGKCVFKLEPLAQNYYKIVKELTKKKQETQSETKIESKKEPPNKVEMTEMTFSSYLKEKGLKGLPENLNDVIIPIISYYGPLKEFAIQCGINPQKGILLYGPPGTGKTSVGGHLATYLGCPEENIQKISTPSLLSKWVGDPERNLRDLFEKARTEYKSRGKDSNLHVIILDELEGLFGERKKAEKSWEKSRVDQFLTLLDGYESTPNILVIGITNHLKDLDEGLLREGRFGCQIYIGLPNKSERKEIYEEYLQVFKNNGRLPEDFDLEKLNDLSVDFSGADIKGVVNTASQKAFSRVANLVFENQITVREAKSHPLNIITNEDFIDAAMKITETKEIKKNS